MIGFVMSFAQDTTKTTNTP